MTISQAIVSRAGRSMLASVLVASMICLAGNTVAAPSKAELGTMLKACSDEADAKGFTVQKGKAEERKTYRRQCMLKKGVAPRTK